MSLGLLKFSGISDKKGSRLIKLIRFELVACFISALIASAGEWCLGLASLLLGHCLPGSCLLSGNKLEG